MWQGVPSPLQQQESRAHLLQQEELGVEEEWELEPQEQQKPGESRPVEEWWWQAEEEELRLPSGELV